MMKGINGLKTSQRMVGAICAAFAERGFCFLDNESLSSAHCQMRMIGQCLKVRFPLVEARTK